MANAMMMRVSFVSVERNLVTITVGNLVTITVGMAHARGDTIINATNWLHSVRNRATCQRQAHEKCCKYKHNATHATEANTGIAIKEVNHSLTVWLSVFPYRSD